MNNLLNQLFRWANRQEENFTTDAFVHLLNYLVIHQPDTALQLLRHLTGERFPLLTPPPPIEITTQAITHDGIPDIRICAPDFIGLVEVKVGSGLGEGQLSSYQNYLNKSGASQTCLTLLSRYPYFSNGDEQPDVAVRWFQVADWLTAELQDNNIDPVGSYLISQFLEYMDARNMTFRQVRSGVSQGLQDLTKNHGRTIMDLGRIRSLGKLAAYPELLPLHDLLMLVGEVIEDMKMPFMLDSGTDEGEWWIGYNINGMQFFICIYFPRVEELVFETYKYKFQKDLWDGKTGSYKTQTNVPRWKRPLDLNSPDIDFFSQPKEKQLHVIETFVHECFDIARNCHLE